MKAYEKWAEQNMYDRTETEKAWKAALEWVLDNFDGKTDILTLGLNIREELEE